ncbi:flavodoxin [bacterium]|nr:flavodoxin [bacterium]
MNIKVIFIICLILIGCSFLFLKQNKGGISMAEAGTNHKVLVAYFSRTGEQYGVGNIKEGNTAIVAKIIAEKTNGDLFEIKVAQDNYPKSYNELTEYAKKEMQQNARPEIVGKVENFSDYDTIFIGYPVWWGDKPMPVYTFIDNYDFNDKTIVPFATHEGSGFCGTQGMDKLGAKILKGLGMYGHVAQKDKPQADKIVSGWLKEIGY